MTYDSICELEGAKGERMDYEGECGYIPCTSTESAVWEVGTTLCTVCTRIALVVWVIVQCV